MAEEDDRPTEPGLCLRGQDPEFSRLANFTDAVFAIAMTLLVLDVGVGSLRDSGDPGEMLSALSDLLPELVAFGVAFILLGRYWMAHHAFVGLLRAFDQRLMTLNLVYLAFVALLPFPSSLVGEYETNPLSILLFAGVLAIISGMETLLYIHARRALLLTRDLTDDEFHWGVVGSMTPVAIFVLTMPLAFVNTTLTLVTWLVLSPIAGAAVDRRARRIDAARPSEG